MLTRNSFKRKIIAFGLVLFLSVSLISTGFAAWVMSTRGEKENEGNVSVGVVEGAQITIDSVTVTNANNEAKIFFEPLSTDDSGRIRHEKGTDGESMKITIKITINNPEFVGKLNVSFVAPEGIKKAIEEGYLTVKNGSDLLTYSKNETGKVIEFGDSERQTSYTTDIVFEFGWGEKFGNMNPGLYYDQEAILLSVTDAQAIKELEIFRSIVYGYDTALTEAYQAIEQAEGEEAKTNAINAKEQLIANNSNLKFLVYVVANPK